MDSDVVPNLDVCNMTAKGILAICLCIEYVTILKINCKIKFHQNVVFVHLKLTTQFVSTIP